MKKHKICIIGDGLAGLTTALTLKTEFTNVDLFSSNTKHLINKDIRTTAISRSNFNFLTKKIGKYKKNLFWSCKKVNLFFENKKKLTNFLNFNEEKKLMYIFENEKLKKVLLKKIKEKKVNVIHSKVKQINLKNDNITAGNNKKKYDLYILCVGAKSPIYEIFMSNRNIKKDYKEISLTGVIEHKGSIINASQFFLTEGPLAILPFKKNLFSFVWSVKKDFYNNNQKIIKKLVKEKIEKILKIKKIKVSRINSYPVNLNLQKKYYKGGFLVLGEGLHSIHPLAGQGFNLVLRDIIELDKMIDKNVQLGISLKNSFLLENFYNKRKPENIIMSLGVDLTNSFFRTRFISRSMKSVILKEFSKLSYLKRISKNISDRGIY